jgi:rod shape-determining protein MreD
VTQPIHGLPGDERWATAVDRWRQLVPLLTCVAALFLMTIPVVTSGPSMPHLALLTVLVWGLFQPSLMPPHVAFVLGVLTDAVLATPLGINATLLPALALAIGALERRYGHRPYAVDWMLAGVLIVIYQYLTWKLLGFGGGELPFAPLLGQAATTLLGYPLAVAVIGRIQRRWVDVI